MKKYFLLLILIVTIAGGYSQGIRFSVQLGAGTPLGDFAQNNQNPKYGGYAKTGWDIKFVGEIIHESNWITGINLGYTLLPVDKEAIKSYINSTNPESVSLDAQPYQNVNLQFRGGYNFSFMENKLNVSPFIDAGIGVFNSAYYLVSQAGGDSFLRSGNPAVGLLVSPGLDLTIAVNDIVGVSLYSSYQFANYNVDEQFSAVNTANTVIYNETISYSYHCINYGIGISFTF